MVSTFHWFFTLNYTDIMMKYKIMKYNINFLPIVLPMIHFIKCFISFV